MNMKEEIICSRAREPERGREREVKKEIESGRETGRETEERDIRGYHTLLDHALEHDYRTMEAIIRYIEQNNF